MAPPAGPGAGPQLGFSQVPVPQGQQLPPREAPFPPSAVHASPQGSFQPTPPNVNIHGSAVPQPYRTYSDPIHMNMRYPTTSGVMATPGIPPPTLHAPSSFFPAHSQAPPFAYQPSKSQESAELVESSGARALQSQDGLEHGQHTQTLGLSDIQERSPATSPVHRQSAAIQSQGASTPTSGQTEPTEQPTKKKRKRGKRGKKHKSSKEGSTSTNMEEQQNQTQLQHPTQQRPVFIPPPPPVVALVSRHARSSHSGALHKAALSAEEADEGVTEIDETLLLEALKLSRKRRQQRQEKLEGSNRQNTPAGGSITEDVNAIQPLKSADDSTTKGPHIEPKPTSIFQRSKPQVTSNSTSSLPRGSLSLSRAVSPQGSPQDLAKSQSLAPVLRLGRLTIVDPRAYDAHNGISDMSDGTRKSKVKPGLRQLALERLSSRNAKFARPSTSSGATRSTCLIPLYASDDEDGDSSESESDSDKAQISSCSVSASPAQCKEQVSEDASDGFDIELAMTLGSGVPRSMSPTPVQASKSPTQSSGMTLAMADNVLTEAVPLATLSGAHVQLVISFRSRALRDQSAMKDLERKVSALESKINQVQQAGTASDGLSPLYKQYSSISAQLKLARNKYLDSAQAYAKILSLAQGSRNTALAALAAAKQASSNLAQQGDKSSATNNNNSSAAVAVSTSRSTPSALDLLKTRNITDLALRARLIAIATRALSDQQKKEVTAAVTKREPQKKFVTGADLLTHQKDLLARLLRDVATPGSPTAAASATLAKRILVAIQKRRARLRSHALQTSRAIADRVRQRRVAAREQRRLEKLTAIQQARRSKLDKKRSQTLGKLSVMAELARARVDYLTHCILSCSELHYSILDPQMISLFITVAQLDPAFMRVDANVWSELNEQTVSLATGRPHSFDSILAYVRTALSRSSESDRNPRDIADPISTIAISEEDSSTASLLDEQLLDVALCSVTIDSPEYSFFKQRLFHLSTWLNRVVAAWMIHHEPVGKHLPEFESVNDLIAAHKQRVDDVQATSSLSNRNNRKKPAVEQNEEHDREHPADQLPMQVGSEVEFDVDHDEDFIPVLNVSFSDSESETSDDDDQIEEVGDSSDEEHQPDETHELGVNDRPSSETLSTPFQFDHEDDLASLFAEAEKQVVMMEGTDSSEIVGEVAPDSDDAENMQDLMGLTELADSVLNDPITALGDDTLLGGESGTSHEADHNCLNEESREWEIKDVGSDIPDPGEVTVEHLNVVAFDEDSEDAVEIALLPLPSPTQKAQLQQSATTASEQAAASPDFSTSTPAFQCFFLQLAQQLSKHPHKELVLKALRCDTFDPEDRQFDYTEEVAQVFLGDVLGGLSPTSLMSLGLSLSETIDIIEGYWITYIKCRFHTCLRAGLRGISGESLDKLRNALQFVKESQVPIAALVNTLNPMLFSRIMLTFSTPLGRTRELRRYLRSQNDSSFDILNLAFDHSCCQSLAIGIQAIEFSYQFAYNRSHISWSAQAKSQIESLLGRTKTVTKAKRREDPAQHSATAHARIAVSKNVRAINAKVALLAKMAAVQAVEQRFFTQIYSLAQAESELPSLASNDFDAMNASASWSLVLRSLALKYLHTLLDFAQDLRFFTRAFPAFSPQGDRLINLQVAPTKASASQTPVCQSLFAIQSIPLPDPRAIILHILSVLGEFSRCGSDSESVAAGAGTIQLFPFDKWPRGPSLPVWAQPPSLPKRPTLVPSRLLQPCDQTYMLLTAIYFIESHCEVLPALPTKLAGAPGANFSTRTGRSSIPGNTLDVELDNLTANDLGRTNVPFPWWQEVPRTFYVVGRDSYSGTEETRLELLSLSDSLFKFCLIERLSRYLSVPTHYFPAHALLEGFDGLISCAKRAYASAFDVQRAKLHKENASETITPMLAPEEKLKISEKLIEGIHLQVVTQADASISTHKANNRIKMDVETRVTILGALISLGLWWLHRSSTGEKPSGSLPLRYTWLTLPVRNRLQELKEAETQCPESDVISGALASLFCITHSGLSWGPEHELKNTQVDRASTIVDGITRVSSISGFNDVTPTDTLGEKRSSASIESKRWESRFHSTLELAHGNIARGLVDSVKPTFNLLWLFVNRMSDQMNVLPCDATERYLTSSLANVTGIRSAFAFLWAQPPQNLFDGRDDFPSPDEFNQSMRSAFCRGFALLAAAYVPCETYFTTIQNLRTCVLSKLSKTSLKGQLTTIMSEINTYLALINSTEGSVIYLEKRVQIDRDSQSHVQAASDDLVDPHLITLAQLYIQARWIQDIAKLFCGLLNLLAACFNAASRAKPHSPNVCRGFIEEFRQTTRTHWATIAETVDCLARSTVLELRIRHRPRLQTLSNRRTTKRHAMSPSARTAEEPDQSLQARRASMLLSVLDSLRRVQNEIENVKHAADGLVASSPKPHNEVSSELSASGPLLQLPSARELERHLSVDELDEKLSAFYVLPVTRVAEEPVHATACNDWLHRLSQSSQDLTRVPNELLRIGVHMLRHQPLHRPWSYTTSLRRVLTQIAAVRQIYLAYPATLALSVRELVQGLVSTETTLSKRYEHVLIKHIIALCFYAYVAPLSVGIVTVVLTCGYDGSETSLPNPVVCAKRKILAATKHVFDSIADGLTLRAVDPSILQFSLAERSAALACMVRCVRRYLIAQVSTSRLASDALIRLRALTRLLTSHLSILSVYSLVYQHRSSSSESKDLSEKYLVPTSHLELTENLKSFTTQTLSSANDIMRTLVFDPLLKLSSMLQFPEMPDADPLNIERSCYKASQAGIAHALALNEEMAEEMGTTK